MKKQIQALNQTQPGLQMKPGKAVTLTHDDKRHGTATLFTALNVHGGTVIGECLPQHLHDEFPKFLKVLDKRTEKALAVQHLFGDDYLCHLGYTTHKHSNVKALLARHPRFHPASASWMNPGELFFRDNTEEQIRLGVFRRVDELKSAIIQGLDHRNAYPKPDQWTAKPEEIFAKLNKAKEILGTLH